MNVRGRIKVYKQDKGYGFITDNESRDVFFHVNQVKSLNEIEKGCFVEFDVAENERGLYATNITIIKKKKFMLFGDVRIKVTNIKNYGIDSWEEAYEYKFTKKEMDERKKSQGIGEKTLIGLLNVMSAVSSFSDGFSGFYGLSESEKRYRARKKLYVTTYQNDNFEFIDKFANFDIDEKIKELDEELNN